jgi:hypothetical protein
MGEMSAVPKGHPLIVAWDAWKQTDGFAATRKWAHVEEHLEGSLWAAFMEGWLAAERAAPSDAALSQDVIAVVRKALEFYAQETVTEFGPVQQSHTHVVERPDGSRTLGFITIDRGEKARAALALLADRKEEK